ncbi:MAG TPA: addiction module protein [Alcanivoracaceae bacterium]|nr:addiction module protein [Alcanivoracaceae bacterium]
MSETTFTFRVDERLKSEFAALAKKHDRSAAQLIRDLMRGFVNEGGSLSEVDARALTAAQKLELDVRYEAYQAGKVETVDAEQAIEALRAKFS